MTGQVADDLAGAGVMTAQDEAVRDAMRGAVSEARRRARQATEVDLAKLPLGNRPFGR